MDEQNCDTVELPSLGEVAGRVFIVNVAAVAGMYAGFATIGFVHQKLSERKKRKHEILEK